MILMTDPLETRLRGVLRDIDDGPMRCAILEADEIAEIADELTRLRERERRLVEALWEIERGEGAYSRDPLTYAANVIERAQDVARAALNHAAPAAQQEGE